MYPVANCSTTYEQACKFILNYWNFLVQAAFNDQFIYLACDI